MKTAFAITIILSFFSFTYAQWFPLNSGTSTQLNSICLIDSNTAYAAGNGGIVLKTTDGGTTWNSFSISQYNLKSISFSDISHGTVVGENGVVYRTTNQGINWLPQTSGTSVTLNSVSFTDEFTGMAVGMELLIKTTNGGESWITKTIPSASWLYSIWLNGPESCTAVGRDGRIIRTSDGGDTWNSQSLYILRDFMSVHFSDNNNGVIVSSGDPMKPPYTYITTNGGMNWISLGFIGATRTLYGSCRSDVNNITVVGESGRIYRTSNGGANWVLHTSGTINDLRSVSFINENIGMTAGAGGVILKTVNGGLPVELISFNAHAIGNTIVLTWSTATEISNKGFQIERKLYQDQEWDKICFIQGKGTTTEIHDYTFVDKELQPGTYNYRLQQVGFNGSCSYSPVLFVNVSGPTEFSLQQNYPNPFNPVTRIKYSIAEKGLVNLSVYNLLGQKAAELLNGTIQPGYYETEFDASSLSSGIYVYKLSAGGRVISRKMVVLK